MRKTILTILGTLIMILICMTGIAAASSVTVADNGVEYRWYTNSTNKYGKDTITLDSVIPHGNKEVVIPSAIEGKPVAIVGSLSLGENDKLESVIIPDGVKLIRYNAFSNCKDLKKVILPNTIEAIDDYAFNNCSSLEEIVIPDSVEIIGIYAFYGCSSLTSVTIPNTVKEFGIGIFRNCTGLKKATIQDGITSISGGMFDGCTNLNSIEIPDSVTVIGGSAFAYCESLTDVVLPSSITEIGAYAFRNCSGLTSFTIPKSVTKIPSGMFSECTGLKTISMPEGVTAIGEFAFSGCSCLENVNIPSTVTTVERQVFGNCKGLKSIVFPAKVENVGEDVLGRREGKVYPDTTYKGTNADIIGQLHGTAANAITSSSITLKWPKFTKATAYKVYRYNDLTRKWKLLTTIDSASTNTYKVTGLSSRTGYKFKVTAVVNGKSYSAESDSIYTYFAKPSKVANVKLTTGSTHYVKAAWDWTDSQGYQIQIATDSKFTKNKKTYKYYSSGTTTKKATKLTKGKTYYVRVRAFNYKGWSEESGIQYGSWSTVKSIVCK